MEIWIVLCRCITIVLVVLIVVLTIVIGKYICQTSKQKHELNLVQEEWKQKKEWENIITEKEKVFIEKANNDKLKDLKEKLDQKMDKGETTPLDLNRIAMLHLLLAGSKESVTAENLQKEIDKIKKTYEILMDKIK